MSTIHNIVVATDFSPGSDAAVERALLLAGTHGAALRLLHAFDVGAWHSLTGVFNAQRLALSPPPDVRTQQRLTDLAAALAMRSGLSVEARFTVGEADAAISAYLSSHDCSLLVIAARADPAVPGLGGVASRVVQASACPVLLVRSTGARPYEQVLSAVDLSAAARRAAVVALALFPGAHHHLLYAVDPARERALWMGDVAKEQTRLLHASLHIQALRQMEQLAQELSRTGEHPVAAEVVDEVPARAVALRALKLPADCVVMGQHGAGAAPAGRLPGSMAQHALQHTLRDVLLVP